MPDPSADVFSRSESDLLVFISSVMTDELRWAREEAVRTFKSFHFAQPWAFEFTPASSEPPDDAYLRKARDADFMVWLVGSRTSQAVVREVNARMATGGRLLVFQLPVPSRAAATSQLLGTVSTYCKWHSVGSAAALPSVLKAAISDEISRALRDPARPARHETLLRWRDSSVARCKQSWIALGVPAGLATQLARDRSVGHVLAVPTASVQLVTGPLGSGKSLAASRLFQHAIELALADASQPFPLFVAARDLRAPLEEHVEGRTAGLVQPRHQPTLIVLDGLDEKGVTEGNDLLNQVQYYVDAYPKSRVVVTSRTLPGLRLSEHQTPVSSLSEGDAVRLISRITGRTVALPELYGWSDSVRAAARRPLFAVMIGVELRRAATLGLHRPVELLDRLARQVVESAPANGEKLDSLLQFLAATAISTGTRVRKTDVAPNHADERQLANSRLVDESNNTFDLTHEVLREWYAARAIIEGTVSLDDVIPASDRWLAPFELVVGSGNPNARDALLHKLASSDPGMAGLVMTQFRDQLHDTESDDTAEAVERVGLQIWQAMDAWRRGLGNLFRAIGPVDAEGHTSALGIRMDGPPVTTSWYKGEKALPQHVVLLPHADEADFHDFDPGWAVMHTEWDSRGLKSPWVMTRRYLTDSLEMTMVTRRFAQPSDCAVQELVWAFALAFVNQGEFSPRPIATTAVLEAVRHLAATLRTGDVLRIRRLEIAVDELGLMERRLEQLLEQGEATLQDPWPRFDRTPSGKTGGVSTWDFYSDDRLLERAAAVYSAALSLYLEMVDRWFACFRSRFQLAPLLPILLEGRLTKSQRAPWKGAPSLMWRARSLPRGKSSRVALEWSSSGDFDLLSYWREEEKNLKVLRPGAEVTPHPIVSDPLPSIDSVRPATDLAHTWLIGGSEATELDEAQHGVATVIAPQLERTLDRWPLSVERTAQTGFAFVLAACGRSTLL